MRHIISVAAILLLPLLTECFSVNQILHSIPPMLPSVAMQRRLRAVGDYPFIRGIDVNNTECLFDGNSCFMNDLLLLTDAAPEPESEVGKFMTKKVSQVYKCVVHKTAADCEADEQNGCLVAVSQYNATNSKIVETCGLSVLKSYQTESAFGLCPNSLMQQTLACSGILDATSREDLLLPPCINRGSIKCKVELSTGDCIPVELEQKYNTIEGAAKLKKDLDTVSTDLWGCCKGRDMFALIYQCGDKSKETCTGKCVWTEATWVPSADASASDTLPVSKMMAGSCNVHPRALMDLLGDANTTLASYVTEGQNKCSKLDRKACLSTPKVKNVSDSKANTYASADLALNKGSGCSSTTPSSPAWLLEATVQYILLGAFTTLMCFWAS